MNESITRKEFLKQLMFWGAVGVSGAMLTSCGGKQEAQPQQTAANDPCTDVSGLPPDQLQTRTSFKYVAASPDPAKLCDICGLWQGFSPDGKCGICQIVKGPINPKGTCTAWVVKPPAPTS